MLGSVLMEDHLGFIQGGADWNGVVVVWWFVGGEYVQSTIGI